MSCFHHYTDMLLLQPLSKALARGNVIAYRVNTTCHMYTNQHEIPSATDTSSMQLDLPVNASCTIYFDARTEPGYNDSLHPASVIIPSHDDGQSMYWHCQLCHLLSNNKLQLFSSWWSVYTLKVICVYTVFCVFVNNCPISHVTAR